MQDSNPINARLNPPESPEAPQLMPTSWGFQPFKEGMAITVFTPDARPLAQVMVTWEQVDLLRSRGVNFAPFKIENTPMSPFNPKEVH